MADMNKGSYRKPRAFNFVSVLILLGLIGAGFYGYHMAPVFFGRQRVKSIVSEAAHKFYKIRSFNNSDRARATNEITTTARGEIIKALGTEPPELTVEMLIDEERKLVNVVAQYHHFVTFTPLDTRRLFRMRIVGESDFQDTGL